MKIWVNFLFVLLFIENVFAQDVSIIKESLGIELEDLTQKIEALGYQRGIDFDISSFSDDYQGKKTKPENLIAPAQVLIQFKKNIPQVKIDEISALITSFDRKAIKEKKETKKKSDSVSAINKLKALGLTDEEISALKN